MLLCICVSVFFFFKQKTAYEMRISDWSSDVCSSDLMSSRQVRSFLNGKASPNWEAVQTLSARLPIAMIQADKLCEQHANELQTLRQMVERHCLREAEIGRASCRERVCT